LGAWLSVPALVIVLAGLVLGSDAIINWAGGVLLAILPLATGAAILRYRLYDLDRIISRTLAYGLLTVLLGLGYAAVVLGLSRLFPQDSSLVVAAATTTPPRPSPPSAPACATTSTWTRSPLNYWQWSTRPCSPLGHRCGYDRKDRRALPRARRHSNPRAPIEQDAAKRPARAQRSLRQSTPKE
jgi:hypothetical protein